MYKFGVYKKINGKDKTRLRRIAEFETFKQAQKLAKVTESSMVLLSLDNKRASD